MIRRPLLLRFHRWLSSDLLGGLLDHQSRLRSGDVRTWSSLRTRMLCWQPWRVKSTPSTRSRMALEDTSRVFSLPLPLCSRMQVLCSLALILRRDRKGFLGTSIGEDASVRWRIRRRLEVGRTKYFGGW